MSARDVIAKALRDNTRVQMSLHCTDAILSALDKAGYAVVPKEPTEAMLKAKIHIKTTGQDVMESRYDLRPTIWKTMLTAAKLSETKQEEPK